MDPFIIKFYNLKDEKLNIFLTDPQRLNSYSYASNNPINSFDADGNLTLKALWHPDAMAAQLTFWHSGINSYLKPQGLNTTASLLQHSLSLYPSDIKISQSNQSQYGNVIDQIKSSREYKSFVEKQIKAFDQENKTSFSINDISGSRSLGFTSSDLSLAIGKAKIDQFNGYKDSQGNWVINTQFSDKYNFEIKTSSQEYKDSWFKTSTNNAAYNSQQIGVITEYNININFTDEISH